MWLHVVLVACCLSLVAGLAGCESLQRKLTRKGKPKPPPTPVTVFQDYSAAMTPLDRYRKHYAIFDYWNSGLQDALESKTPNPKRITLTSTEALGELEEMKRLLSDEAAARFDAVLKEQTAIHRAVSGAGFDPMRSDLIKRRLESHTRAIHRDFFWRKVEDQLKEP